jgi:3',5'-cyclic-AMP phosphodiesterase
MKGISAMRKNVSPALVLLTALAIAPVSAESVRFAVLGDTRGPNGANPIDLEVFPKIVQHIFNADPPVQFIIVTGDLAYGTDEPLALAEEFRQWRQIVQPWYDASGYGAKVYPVPGNHDHPDLIGVWQQAFPELPDTGPENNKKLTYSFDAGPCHLVVINTYPPDPPGSHSVNLAWLADDLARTAQPVKLVFGHDPAYPFGPHAGSSLDAYPDLRDQFWQLLTANNVPAYLCGHEHMYDHWMKDNVHQIISGGGGAPGFDYHYLIIDADGTDVTVSLYSASRGELRDQYKLSDTAGVPRDDRSAGNANWLLNLLVPCTAGFLIVLAGLGTCGGLLIYTPRSE